MDDDAKPKTGAERARLWRERQQQARAPSVVQFDRELRRIIVENVGNGGMTPARALGITRDRLARRYSVEGINRILSGFGRGRG